MLDLCAMIKRLEQLRDIGVALNVIAEAWGITEWTLRSRIKIDKRCKFSPKRATALLNEIGYRVKGNEAYYFNIYERDVAVETALSRYGFSFKQYPKKSDFRLITLLLGDDEVRKYEYYRLQTQKESKKQRVRNYKNGIR